MRLPPPRRQVQAGNASFHEGRAQGHMLLAAERRIGALQTGGALADIEGGFPRPNAQGAAKAQLCIGQFQAVFESGCGRIGLLLEHRPGEVRRLAVVVTLGLLFGFGEVAKVIEAKGVASQRGQQPAFSRTVGIQVFFRFVVFRFDARPRRFPQRIHIDIG